MKKIKVMTVFGTRPEAVKMAPLVKELQSRNEIISICCVTGQHREMLDSMLQVYGITPDYDLDIMEKNQTLSTITCKALAGMEDVLKKEQPDILLVHGDTTTTFSGALAAFYQQIPVGHVEAGLRTWDKYSPFPEEINRTLVGRIAELNFAPTSSNAANLRAEGVTEGIFITGNTVIDAMKYTVRDDYVFESDALNSLDFENKKVITVTCHRRENYGKPLQDIMLALKKLVETYEDVVIVDPVHLSPVVRETVFGTIGELDRVCLIDPLPVDEMHNLMARSYMIITDSGGLQEEAPALGKPVLVVRKETERPEAVKAGTVKLAGVETDVIFDMASELLTNEEAYQQMAKAVNPYGDGNASKRIVDAILWHFGVSDKQPEDFKG
ncbi:MAG: UDP-N-acetylglucosamine 2-epimerase (non-hydrolyzing) [Ruminococcaceae bacterium]|nr:UDP-N-acetylglucosamine 2-epimerase (non-hydrolyzing) [Oscillospiraceae bacterium]